MSQFFLNIWRIEKQQIAYNTNFKTSSQMCCSFCILNYKNFSKLYNGFLLWFDVLFQFKFALVGNNKLCLVVIQS